jgi:hypothetical protein
VAATVPPTPGQDAGGMPAISPERSMRLGEILIARGKIDAEDLERALELQRERGDKIGKIFVDMGLLAQRDMLAALSDQLGIPLAAVDGEPPSAPEIDGLSHRFLRQCRVFPLELRRTSSLWRWPIRWISRPSRRCAPSPGSISAPCWRRNRKSSTRSSGTTARPNARLSPRAATKRTPTSNTCATWRAKRRSSAWSTP